MHISQNKCMYKTGVFSTAHIVKIIRSKAFHGFVLQRTADLLVKQAFKQLMTVNVEIVKVENVLFPAHVLQQTSIFIDLDEMNL